MSFAAVSPTSLERIFLAVAARIDGAALVGARLKEEAVAPTAVLAVGKVAFPMFEGLRAHGKLPRRALLIAPATRFPASVDLPAGSTAVVSDHPNPTERSVDAGRAALAFVRALSPADRLLVLLSGGGSSLMCSPAPGLSLDDKRTAVRAVSRGGATIGQLNTVRKHLSAIKGGQLGVATGAPTMVWALSDVVGNDPATIASGPFSPDPTTFAEADALLRQLAPDSPAGVMDHIARGIDGEVPETPKPEHHVLSHVRYEVIASPERVGEEARREVENSGWSAGLLSRNVESDVESLAGAYIERARREAQAGGRARVFVGNGEPSIVVRGNGRGGRATHLALLVARGIAGLPVSFLAAGTDDRDGSADASGAVVDGSTWDKAVAAGLNPEDALANSDSAAPLEALGALIRGPGSSNLLDLHLLAVGG